MKDEFMLYVSAAIFDIALIVLLILCCNGILNWFNLLWLLPPALNTTLFTAKVVIPMMKNETLVEENE